MELTLTKTINFAEIDNLEQGSYHVVACNDPKCIFKRLIDAEDMVLIIHRSTSYGYNLFNRFQTTAYLYEDTQYATNAKKINVLVENDFVLEPYSENQKRNRSEIFLQMRSRNNVLKARFSFYRKEGKFVRKKGNFINFFGCNFPLEWFFSFQKPEKFSEIYEGYGSIIYALKRCTFPIDISICEILLNYYIPGMVSDKYVPSPKASGISM